MVPPAVHLEAKDISQQYESIILFSLFATCHNVYSMSRKISLSEVNDLGELCVHDYIIIIIDVA